MKSTVIWILLSGAGASFLWYAIAKIFPDEKKKAWGVKIGRAISSFGRLKFGKDFWERTEEEIEKGGATFFGGIKEGMDADDNTNGNDNGKG